MFQARPTPLGEVLAALAAFSGQWGDNEECEQEGRTFEILGPSGHVCAVTVGSYARTTDIKVAIEKETGISVASQRLFHDLRDSRRGGASSVAAPEDPRSEQLRPSALTSRWWAVDLPAVVPSRSLVHDLQELRDGASLVDLPEDSSLLLVRRTDTQLSCLQELDALDPLSPGALSAMTHGEHPVAAWLRQASQEARSDPEVVLAAVRRNGSALRHAAEELRDEQRVVLEAVAQHGLALEFASPALRATREVVIKAVEQHAGAAKFALPALLEDEEVQEAIELSETEAMLAQLEAEWASSKWRWMGPVF